MDGRQLWADMDSEKGATVDLTLDNLPIYERPIRNYEGNSLEVKDGKIYINGQETTKYTFKMDYYWMMGDNRHNSAVPVSGVLCRKTISWVSRFSSGCHWIRTADGLTERFAGVACSSL